jgi:hypothetical protein
MAFDISPYLSGGRHVVTFAAGIAAGVGYTAIGGVSNGDLVVSFNHIFNGLSEVAVGLGPVVAAGMGIWATFKGTIASKVTDVHAAAPDVLANAVKAVEPAVLLDAAAGVPGTTKIVTTPALAQATASPKVVS